MLCRYDHWTCPAPPFLMIDLVITTNKESCILKSSDLTKALYQKTTEERYGFRRGTHYTDIVGRIARLPIHCAYLSPITQECSLGRLPMMPFTFRQFLAHQSTSLLKYSTIMPYHKVLSKSIAVISKTRSRNPFNIPIPPSLSFSTFLRSSGIPLSQSICRKGCHWYAAHKDFHCTWHSLIYS